MRRRAEETIGNGADVTAELRHAAEKYAGRALNRHTSVIHVHGLVKNRGRAERDRLRRKVEAVLLVSAARQKQRAGSRRAAVERDVGYDDARRHAGKTGREL